MKWRIIYLNFKTLQSMSVLVIYKSYNYYLYGNSYHLSYFIADKKVSDSIPGLEQKELLSFSVSHALASEIMLSRRSRSSWISMGLIIRKLVLSNSVYPRGCGGPVPVDPQKNCPTYKTGWTSCWPQITLKLIKGKKKKEYFLNK